MIVLRRAEQRRYHSGPRGEVWHTFFPQHGSEPLAQGFGTLESLDEERRPVGSGHRRYRHRDAELLTYVREGALTYQDSTGSAGVLSAGEFMRRTTDRLLRHGESNGSPQHGAHLFHLWIGPNARASAAGHEQRRFGAGERRAGLCVVASPDGRRGSVRVHQNTLVFSALLEPGQHVAHELRPGRTAWLHVVQGEVALGEVVLGAGDGVGITQERVLSLTAREASEILVVDQGTPHEEAPLHHFDRAIVARG